MPSRQGTTGAHRRSERSTQHRMTDLPYSAEQMQVFADLSIPHIGAAFADRNFASQPKYLVNVAVTDASLLTQLYEYVRDNTPRGAVLDQFPLKMAGVHTNDEARQFVAANLRRAGIPYVVLPGDIGNPEQLLAALQAHDVEADKCLHVHSLVEHLRSCANANGSIAQGSAFAAFANHQVTSSDCSGEGGHRFASLVKHLTRWSDALKGSHGLCMLEAALFNATTTNGSFDFRELHPDVAQFVSEHHMVSAAAFALAGSMAGLFPKNYKAVQAYGDQSQRCLLLSQHLVPRQYRIRLAERDDLPQLLHLEQSWAPHLRCPAELLLKRLETSPTTSLVCESDGRLVAVLYIQRLSNLEDVQRTTYGALPAVHAPGGRYLQLMSIASDPDAGIQGVGSELRAFALHLARRRASVDSVVAVTRCSGFKGRRQSVERYVNSHVEGRVRDPTLGFHTGHGAEIVQLVHDFRDEDVDNHGIGVLIKYNVKASTPMSAPSHYETSPVALTTAAREEVSGAPSPCSSRRKGRKDRSPCKSTMSTRTTLPGSMSDSDSSSGLSEASSTTSRSCSPHSRTSSFSGTTSKTPRSAASAGNDDREHCRNQASLPIVVTLMEELGYGDDVNENLDRGFLEYGLDSLELDHLRGRLGDRVGLDLPPTLLYDYPSVRDLADYLDDLLNASRSGPASASGCTRPHKARAAPTSHPCALPSTSSAQASLAIIVDLMQLLGYGDDVGDNLDRGFLEHGMDSLELDHLRGRLGDRVGMDLPPTLLYDYPSVRTLADHIDGTVHAARTSLATVCAPSSTSRSTPCLPLPSKRQPSSFTASSAQATLPIVVNLMEELGYGDDVNENLDRGFLECGLDSLELDHLRGRLGDLVGLDLPATLLYDYPSVRVLAEHLDGMLNVAQDADIKRTRATPTPSSCRGDIHGSGKEARDSSEEQRQGKGSRQPRSAPSPRGFRAAHQKPGPKRKQQTVSELTARQLVAVQDACRALFSQPSYQQRFAKLAEKCYPDIPKYIQDVESLIVEVEGRVFFDHGMVASLDYQAIQKCRREMTAVVMRHWRHPEVRARSLEMLRLTKQDTPW